MAKVRSQKQLYPSILILAMGKSGTSALYNLIQQSVKYKFSKCIHEPAKINKAEKGFLVKANLESCYDSLTLRTIMEYEKRILLIRDPRDRLISALLYRCYDHMRRNKSNQEQWLALIKEKQADPSSLSVLTLIEKYKDLTGVNLLKIQEQYMDLLIKLDSDLFFIYKYEDLVENRNKKLAAYLGINLRNNLERIRVPKLRVKRTATSGDWKNWFTEDDVLHLSNNPLWVRFFDTFDYDRASWKLPKSRDQHITPESSYLYVDKLNKRKE